MSSQFHHIPSLLKPEELTILEQLITASAFVNEKATASMDAKEVKNNQQLERAADGYMDQIQ